MVISLYRTMIDTHTHLYDRQFDADRAAMIQRAKDAGVTKVFLPNIDSETILPMLQMEKDYPQYCYPMMGLHPTSVKGNYEEELAIVKKYLDEREFVAVGEIGIDLYWDKTFKEQQIEAFLVQAKWAEELDIPIIIHARKSLDLLIELVQDIKNPKVRGIFHCFTGSAQQARRIVDLGFLLGIGGVLTFKNAKLRDEIRDIPLESLVLETDAPYLTPHPFRGKRNESSYVKYVLEHLAETRGLAPKKVEEVTTKNAEKLFFGAES